MRLPRMLSIDLVQNSPDTPSVPAVHPYHELVYLLTPGYRTVVRGREYRGEPGDVSATVIRAAARWRGDLNPADAPGRRRGAQGRLDKQAQRPAASHERVKHTLTGCA